jgi:hypothetical protein
MQIDIESAKRSETTFRIAFPEIPTKAKSFKAFWREDKTPSASFVRMESGTWIIKDFAAGKSYDLFGALLEFKGLNSFKEALKFVSISFPEFNIEEEKNPIEWAQRRNIGLGSIEINSNNGIDYDYIHWLNGEKLGTKTRLFGQEDKFACTNGLSLVTHFFHRNLGHTKRLYVLGSEGDCIATSLQTQESCIAISGEAGRLPTELIKCINHYGFESVVIIYDNPLFEPVSNSPVKQKELSKELFALESVKIVKGVNWQGSHYKDISQFLATGKTLDDLNLEVIDCEVVNEDIEVLKSSIDELKTDEDSGLELHRVLPVELSSYLNKIAHAIDNNFPPEAVLTYFLGIISGLIGTAFQLKGKHSVLWSCVALPVGAGKSDALKFLLRPLAIREMEFDRVFRQELEAYNIEQKQHHKKTEDFRPQKMPTAKHILLEDSTIEAVRKVYCNNKEGIIIAYDELAKFFQSHGQYKSKGGDDRATYLSLASGTGINLTRVDETQNIRTLKSAVSLTGGIQPAVLQQIYKADTQKDDGLWDRFLYYYKSNYKISENYNEQSLPAPGLLFSLYDWILANRGMGEVFDFEFESGDYTKVVSVTLKKQINEAEGALKGYLSKQFNQWLQLCLILHVLECAVSRELKRTISSDTAHKALLCLGFYKSQAVTFFGRADTSDKVNLYSRILDLEDLTARNLISLKLAKNKKEVESIFREMEKAGYGRLRYTDRNAVYFERT